LPSPTRPHDDRHWLRIWPPVPVQVAGQAPAPSRPCPEDAARIAGFVREHPSWSAFWDKQWALWRVTEDDPDSSLYAASADASIVIGYMTLHVL
jgi:hypothetical protein